MPDTKAKDNYTRVNWLDGSTPINQDNLNNMDNAIAQLFNDEVPELNNNIDHIKNVIGDVDQLGNATIISSITSTSDKVAALETTVGNSSRGLVKDVNTLKEASATHVTKQEFHIEMETIQSEIDAEKTRSEMEDNNHNSAITQLSTELGSTKGRVTLAEGDIHNLKTTSATKTELNNKADKDTVDMLSMTVNRIDNTLGTESSGLYKRVEDLEETIGSEFSDGLVMDVNQLTNDVNDIKDTLENFNPDVDLDDYYTKTEVNNTFVTATEVDSKVATSVSNYVSSTEFNNRLTQEVTNVTSSNYYTKDQTNSTFAKSSDVYTKSNVYTKTEVDGKLTNYHTKDHTISVDDEVILYCGDSSTNFFTK